MKKRPPVVTVMGHIDHGKTTLLSKIRERDLTQKEFGGITQHIGAYQIEHQGKQITFIDTPGHVAFSKMRTRGAEVTDLVVLVVAADDGVMPQTKESLEHIKAAKVPFLVAINKMDLPQAKPKMVQKQLQKEGVLVEELGGDVVSVEISAKTGQGVDELLELILLMSEMEELRADPNGPLEAVIIESKLDHRRGPLATVLVKNGSLRIGEEIRARDSLGKVKAMFDEDGERVKTARPSQPVEVLGFKEVPPIGSKVVKTEMKMTTKKAIAHLQLTAVKAVGQAKKTVEPKTATDEDQLKLILKSDVQGTLEAIIGSLPKEIQVIFQGVGDINESDVLLAATTGADIIGFNVRMPSVVAKLAKTEKVKVKLYNVIYELLDEVKKWLEKPKIEKRVLGEGEVIAEFKIKEERIAGCRVKKGKITKTDKLHLKRGKEALGEIEIKSMKHRREDITEAVAGEEFGAVFTPSLDFKIGDGIIAYNQKNESET